MFLMQVSGPAQVQVASSNVIDTAANNAALKADTNGLAALIASSIEGGGATQYVGYLLEGHYASKESVTCDRSNRTAEVCARGQGRRRRRGEAAG
mgnify:CR=1 FL=1